MNHKFSILITIHLCLTLAIICGIYGKLQIFYRTIIVNRFTRVNFFFHFFTFFFLNIIVIFEMLVRVFDDFVSSVFTATRYVLFVRIKRVAL